MQRSACQHACACACVCVCKSREAPGISTLGGRQGEVGTTLIQFFLPKYLLALLLPPSDLFEHCRYFPARGVAHLQAEANSLRTKEMPQLRAGNNPLSLCGILPSSFLPSSPKAIPCSIPDPGLSWCFFLAVEKIPLLSCCSLHDHRKS